MNKKIITALAASLLFIPIVANAATPAPIPTLAILDTGIDTSLPEFKDKIAYEVCILEWNTCPNNQKFMEGPGSAVIPAKFISSNGLDHGTQMAFAAIKTNPNMKIVFVRIIGVTASGSRQVTGEISVVNALNWVLQNKDKFNIQAVSLAQTHHVLLNGTNYCPNTNLTSGVIKALAQVNVPFFAAAGNNRDYSRIDWPACIPDSIGVGATMDGDYIAVYSNADKNLLDFYALGSMRVKGPAGKEVNAAGTSIATQVAAATWVGVKDKNMSMLYQDIYNKFVQTSIATAGRGTSGKLINTFGLLNG